MPPPHDNQRQQPVELSADELAQVEAYAEARGITTDEAATELARATLNARYRRGGRLDARVIPLRQRH